MYLRVKKELLPVTINRKTSTKNTYMRVKNGNEIYVTTNIFTTENQIKKILTEHISDIEKMFNFEQKKADYENKFYYLGKVYDEVLTNESTIRLGLNKVFIPRNFNLDKWYQAEAKVLFKDRLDYWYQKFSRRIPYPSLRIRKMKTRWGVCNTKDIVITLNLELMKRDTNALDYVIVHELSHLIEGNHSSKFWKVVEENYPNYKVIRNELKKYE